jgi:hypothetical protein
MAGGEGALARKLDFGEFTTAVTSTGSTGRASLRLAAPSRALPAPDKYQQLERRRRTAQINARHLLDRMEPGE